MDERDVPWGGRPPVYRRPDPKGYDPYPAPPPVYGNPLGTLGGSGNVSNGPATGHGPMNPGHGGTGGALGYGPATTGGGLLSYNPTGNGISGGGGVNGMIDPGGGRSGRDGPNNGGGPPRPIPPGGGVDAGMDPGGTAPVYTGASQAWRNNRQAQIDAARTRVAGMKPEEGQGWRKDEQGNPYYYYGAKADPSAYQTPEYKAWTDSLINPAHDSFSARRALQTTPWGTQIPTLARPKAAPVMPPGGGPGGGGAGSVTETPSTHAQPNPGIQAPYQQPMPQPYYPLGQSGITMQQPQQPQSKAAQYGSIGGGPQTTGSQPSGGGGGFAPANAPNSQAASQAGAYYGGRTNRMAQRQGIASYNRTDPGAADRPSATTTMMDSQYRNNRNKYMGM